MARKKKVAKKKVAKKKKKVGKLVPARYNGKRKR